MGQGVQLGGGTSGVRGRPSPVDRPNGGVPFTSPFFGGTGRGRACSTGTA